MRFQFNSYPVVEKEHFLRNMDLARKRELPKPQFAKRPPLAIVGGGPSANRFVDKLKNWKHDIWVIGSAYPWAMQNGIKATFFNVDPLPEQAEYAKGAEHAILCSMCDPAVFDAVPNVEMFELLSEAHNINHGSTAVTATPCLALEMGYTAIVYFGCESSFDKTTHAYEFVHPYRPNMGIWVRCGDHVYATDPALLMQAQLLAETFRLCPLVFRECGGGLLRALIDEPQFDIVAVEQSTHDLMEFELNGEKMSREQARQMLPIVNMAL